MCGCCTFRCTSLYSSADVTWLETMAEAVARVVPDADLRLCGRETSLSSGSARLRFFEPRRLNLAAASITALKVPNPFSGDGGPSTGESERDPLRGGVSREEEKRIESVPVGESGEEE